MDIKRLIDLFVSRSIYSQKAGNVKVETNDNTCVLFSYKEPIAKWVGGKLLITSRVWSLTTTRHTNMVRRFAKSAGVEYEESPL